MGQAGQGINHGNHTAITTVIHAFLCPSSARSETIQTDGHHTNLLTNQRIDGWHAAVSDYSVNDGISRSVWQAGFAAPPGDLGAAHLRRHPGDHVPEQTEADLRGPGRPLPHLPYLRGRRPP
ncbi:hypothetical protein [Tautonia sociabilis]|uniref:hypothetical protein n=1 Tax=Tautonia sociabilis TaxID=2080755 RepID=UPI001F1BB5F2|nr:hypothetical protein [Tautonia sociabilis]